jgi:hypothetical protein
VDKICCLEDHEEGGKRTGMKIHLWYNDRLKRWNWVLTTEGETPIRQESGHREDIHDAMNDIARTVEYLTK